MRNSKKSFRKNTGFQAWVWMLFYSMSLISMCFVMCISCSFNWLGKAMVWNRNIPKKWKFVLAEMCRTPPPPIQQPAGFSIVACCIREMISIYNNSITLILRPRSEPKQIGINIVVVAERDLITSMHLLSTFVLSL